MLERGRPVQRIVTVVAVAFLVLAVALLAAAPRGAAQQQPASQSAACGGGWTLLNAGFFAEAQAAFAKQAATDSCGVAGLKAVRLAQSRPLNADAKAQFDARVAVIRSLEAEGFEQAARDRAKALVETYPKQDVPEDVRALSQPIGWWRQAKGDAGPPLQLALELAIVLLVAGIVVLLLVKAIPALIGRLRNRYTIGDVTGPVSADVAGLGDVLAAELSHFAGGGDAHTQLRRVPAAEGDFRVPDAVAQSYPESNVIAGLLSLLDRLLPRRLIKISVAALPTDPDRGVGVTVTIAGRDGHELPDGSLTLWEADLGPVDAAGSAAPRLSRLLIAAAVWVAYHPEVAVGPERSVLGTTVWRSYAYFALGERAQNAGHLDAARRLYCKALDASAGCHVGARLNLAGLLLYRPSDPRQHDDPAKRLVLAYWLLHDPAVEDWIAALPAPTRQRLWWRCCYLRAARALVALPCAGATPPGIPVAVDVHGLLDDLAAARAQDRLAQEMYWPAYLLGQSLRVVQLQAAGAAEHEVLKVEAETEAELERQWWTANTLYNLACFYVRTGSLELAAERLRDALRRSTEPDLLLSMARSDPALDPVTKPLEASEADALLGKAAPSDDADVEWGHALGVKIREAVDTAMQRGNGNGDGAPSWLAAAIDWSFKG